MMSSGLALGFLVMTVVAPGDSPVVFPETVGALGETGLRLQQAHARLCAPPLDDLRFVLSDVNFAFKRRFTEYSGDVSGRMLGALNAASAVLGHPADMLAPLQAALPPYQQEDGHFGAPQHLAESVDQKRDMPILWGNGRLLLAMAECAHHHADPKLLESALCLGDYVISTRPYYGLRENFERVGGAFASGFTTCYPSLIDGLVALGGVTGESRFLDEARFIGELSLLDRSFDKHHSHGRLVAYRGMLDLDRNTGTRDFVDAIAQGCAHITENLLLPTGGITEVFDRDYPRDEGCSEADWIRVNVLLWMATGDIAYLDIAEDALCNHVPGTQFSNGGFGHRTFTPLRHGGQSYPAGHFEHFGSDSYWCCSMHVTQVLADAVHWGCAVSGKSLLITWLSEFAAKADVAGQLLAVHVQQQDRGAWRIQLDAAEATSLTLRLRLPGWAQTVSVDGVARQDKDGWVDIPCEWTGTQQFEVVFPDTIREAGTYRPEREAGAPVRLFAGRDLYCLPDMYLAPDAIVKGAVPRIVLCAQRPEADKIPVLVRGKEGKFFQAVLEPFPKRPPGGCSLLFHLERVSAAQFAESLEKAEAPRRPDRPIEFMAATEKPYDVYLNGEQVFHHQGWSESPRVTVFPKPGANVFAVKTPAETPHPGLIGLILIDGHTHCTRPEDWSAVYCAQEPPKAWLAELAQGPQQVAAPQDLGGFGTAPWNHVPAHYAGTEARWIWPAAAKSEGATWCLFRYTFERPTK